MKSIRTFSAFLVISLSGPFHLAQAQSLVQGGGASVPANLYKGSADSILPNSFSYAITGSGKGKKAFLGDDPSLFGNIGTVHFAASDSVLTAAELSDYTNAYNVPTTNQKYGALIQIPTALVPVVIPFNKPGAKLDLSINDICGVFAGKITDWSQLSSGWSSGQSGPVTVVYRPESSGSTEILTRFLSAACKPVDLFGTSLKPQSNWSGSAPGFSIQTSFAGLFSNNTAPSNFLPAVATGDTSLLDTVNSGNGRIGYTGPNVMANPDDATKVARVIGFSPKDVSIPATIGAVSPPTSAQDIADPLKWVPNIAYPSTGYPIVGFTNLIIGQCYKRPIVASAIRSFLFNHYGSAGDSSQDQGPNDATLRAHWFYPLDRTWREAIRTRFALASSSTGLNNPGACNGIGRP